VSLDLDKIRKHSVLTRDGFYHVVGNHYCLRGADFDALVAEVERLRGERAAVVTWLRAGTAECRYCLDAAVIGFAAGIERGEHRSEEEP